MTIARILLVQGFTGSKTVPFVDVAVPGQAHNMLHDFRVFFNRSLRFDSIYLNELIRNDRSLLSVERIN